MFHVTVVFVAAATELAVTPPNNPATTNTTTTARPRTPRTKPNITKPPTDHIETKHLRRLTLPPPATEVNTRTTSQHPAT